MAADLSQAHCILLAVNYASESNIKALHTLVPSRTDALTPELVLRILLTYLPESIPPSTYTTFVNELVTHLWLEQQDSTSLDLSSVNDLSDATAQKRVKKLTLLELVPPAFPPHAPKDDLTKFLCHRARKIDLETGLLSLVPELFAPFLDRNEWIRSWYISVVLPLLRLQYYYYPDTESPISLDAFEKLDGEPAIEILLSRATATKHEITSSTESEGTIGRDLKGLVGPWMYGHTERKRRKLAMAQDEENGQNKRIDLLGATAGDRTNHDWEYIYKWLVHKAVDDFSMVTNAIEEWNGPTDVDLGGVVKNTSYLDEKLRTKLDKRYAQAAFASCYAVEANTPEAIDGAHGILVRLAELLDFEPPPDLATSVEQLPKVDQQAAQIHESTSTVLLDPDVLMEPTHPLTSPTLSAFMLLQMLVYSAYQLSGLGHSISILNITKFRFYSDEDEQMSMIQKILHGLAREGKRDDQQWTGDRNRLLWLWNWNIDPEEGALRGAGPFGHIPRDALEKEILKAMIATGNYSLIDSVYISDEPVTSRLSKEELEAVVIGEAMTCYDNASNGNRTRGSMRKASEILDAFRSNFVGSKAFERATALIAATHALSYYSLTLQHGVPFQPVNIRVNQDPLSLLPKVLEQNPKSYTKLDDLISIGRNLAKAGLTTPHSDTGIPVDLSPSEIDSAIQTAERRVIFMCIEAALTADDFDTAYSYLISRLAPETASITPPTIDPSDPRNSTQTAPEDDISWRAAFLAGRYRPRQTTASPSLPSQLRRLEQRTELLSLSLLLAPPPNLSEILTVYRRSEEEMSALTTQLSEHESSSSLPSQASAMPGIWTESSTEGMTFGQGTREMGRFYNSTETKTRDEEAPVGLFDLARGAAGAFSRNAFPLRQGHSNHSARPVSMEENQVEQDRVRKRDMLSNAASGALASGLGWVLGASPVATAERERERGQ